MRRVSYTVALMVTSLAMGAAATATVGQVSPASDVALTKSAPTSIAAEAGAIDYIIRVTNTQSTPVPMSEVEVVDEMTGRAPVILKAAGSPLDGSVLAPGASLTFTHRAAISAAECGMTVKNAARVRLMIDGVQIAESDLGNNAESVETTVVCTPPPGGGTGEPVTPPATSPPTTLPDLPVSPGQVPVPPQATPQEPQAPARRLVSRAPRGRARLLLVKHAPRRARAGQAVRYRLVVSSVGGTAATGVVVTDRMPSGVVLPDVTRGMRVQGSLITWRLGRLVPGQRRVLLVPAVASPARSGCVTNRAEARAANAGRVLASARTCLRVQPRPAPRVTG